MRHRINAFLAILIILLGASPAALADKPTVAVLGLEVIDDGSGIDAKTTELAKILTEALRTRAQMGTSPFKLAPNSEKDLLEMKLLSGCADEGRTCMANIGRELGAERLIYGKIERRDTGYQVSLKLLNAETKAMERSTSDVVPFNDNNGPAINNKWSRTLFNRLTGVPEQGNLSIQANVSQGSVYIDGEVATALNGGRAQVSSLSEGKHKVAIEAEGHRRYETEVTIEAGQTESIDARLESSAVGGAGGSVGADGGGSVQGSAGGRPGGVSRALFWTTVVTTAAGVTATTITGLKVLGQEDKMDDFLKSQSGTYPDAFYTEEGGPDVDPCDVAFDSNYDTVPNINGLRDRCNDGKSNARLTNIFLGVSVVSALAAGYFYYAGYIQPKSSESNVARTKGTSRSNQANVQVAPTVTPNYFGAGVKIEF